MIYSLLFNLFVVAGVLAANRLARRRRVKLTVWMHELRQALTAARLMIDLLPALGSGREDACSAASDEMSRAYHAMILFENTLHAPLAPRPTLRRPVARRAADVAPAGGVITARREFERLVLIWGQAARALGRTLEFDWQAGPAPIVGERRVLAEVVGNLLSNAIRHGEGRVRIAARERDGELRVEIADQGPGLKRPVAALAARRLGALRRLGPHGHGLGVAVRAAARLGGTISSAPSAEGATLVVELPLAEADPSVAGTPGGVGPSRDRRPVGVHGDDQ